MERILLVEDDGQIVESLSDFLRGEGFAVETAAGQRQALAKMERTVYDLLLLDISLSDGNGYAICAAAKASGDTAVIFLTASADEYSTVAGLDMGAESAACCAGRPRLRRFWNIRACAWTRCGAA